MDGQGPRRDQQADDWAYRRVVAMVQAVGALAVVADTMAPWPWPKRSPHCGHRGGGHYSD